MNRAYFVQTANFYEQKQYASSIRPLKNNFVRIKLLCKPLLLVIAFSILLLNSFSQEIVNDSLTLDEVIITGTPVKINKNNVPMAVSVVNREQIAESDESALLPILNGRVPGLFVTERGVTGFGVSQWCCWADYYAWCGR